MNNLSIIISCISSLIAVGSFIWVIINDTKNRKFQHQLTITQSKLDNSNYVSQILIDTTLNQFKNISVSLFDNYNNANVLLFPHLEEVICKLPTIDEKRNKMLEYLNKSVADINNLVKLKQINRNILTKEMITKIEEFISTIEQLITMYQYKIEDLKRDKLDKYILHTDNQECTQKAELTETLYNEIMEIFNTYIGSLCIK